MPTPLPPAELAIVHAVNAQRAAFGLPALRAVRGLSRSAQRHSVDQLRHDRLDHTSSDGTSFARRIARTGHSGPSGEVLAFAPRGSRSRARAVVRMWMRSPPHRAELLSPGFHVLGVGRAKGGLGRYPGTVVTADFSRR